MIRTIFNISNIATIQTTAIALLISPRREGQPSARTDSHQPERVFKRIAALSNWRISIGPERNRSRASARSNKPVPETQAQMNPGPDCGEDSNRGSGKLTGKRAIITGGDSGIDRAVAIAFARERADVRTTSQTPAAGAS